LLLQHELARIRDKKGEIVKIVRYESWYFSGKAMKQVIRLFRQGYPDSFDDYDLRQIEADLVKEGLCLLAVKKSKLVGALQFTKWPAIQAGWLLSYFFVKEKGAGIGEILCASLEEFLEKEARIIFTTHAGILPDYVSSYGFFPKMGYQEWGILQGYFRDDIWGIFFAKRNPHYRIGRGIPKNSGWCKEMIDERTGRHISQDEYQKIKYGLEPVAEEKWGFNMIARENVIECGI